MIFIRAIVKSGGAHNLIQARSYLLTIQIQETLDELSRIDAEMDAISGKIVTRARQLNADVMTTRTDPIISDLWRARAGKSLHAEYSGCSGQDRT